MKEQDCAAEGFYYVTKGYRKIPGNLCEGGLDLEPTKKSCSVLGSINNSKQLILAAITLAALYYGWPMIEPFILALPLPVDQLDKMKNAAGSAAEMASGALSSAQGASSVPADYSQNLENQPDAFLEDEIHHEHDPGEDGGRDHGHDRERHELLAAGPCDPAQLLADFAQELPEADPLLALPLLHALLARLLLPLLFLLLEPSQLSVHERSFFTAYCLMGVLLLAGAEGLEPPTAGFGDQCSAKLSYAPR